MGAWLLFILELTSGACRLNLRFFISPVFAIVLNLDINYSGLNLSCRAVTFDDF